jgi:hypothetical protein
MSMHAHDEELAALLLRVADHGHDLEVGQVVMMILVMKRSGCASEEE